MLFKPPNHTHNLSHRRCRWRESTILATKVFLCKQKRNSSLPLIATEMKTGTSRDNKNASLLAENDQKIRSWYSAQVQILRSASENANTNQGKLCFSGHTLTFSFSFLITPSCASSSYLQRVERYVGSFHRLMWKYLTSAAPRVGGSVGRKGGGGSSRSTVVRSAVFQWSRRRCVSVTLTFARRLTHRSRPFRKSAFIIMACRAAKGWGRMWWQSQELLTHRVGLITPLRIVGPRKVSTKQEQFYWEVLSWFGSLLVG